MTELIVALDAPFHRSVELYAALCGTVRWFKIGVPALLQEGGVILAENIAKNDNSSLMLDLKTYDTRDTVLRAVDAAAKMGADMMTVHVACIEHAIGNGVDILAVGRLTDGTGLADYLVDHVPSLADGIICTAWQAVSLRPKTDKLLVCPGIRPIGAVGDNHAIPATPRDAAKFGADFIVVGRPIYNSPDPVEAAKNILREIDHGPV